MVKIEAAAFIAFLQAKWKGRSCPMCGVGNWLVADRPHQLLEFSGGNLILGGAVYPVVPVTCDNCGNTVLVSAVIAGVVQPDPAPPSTASPTSSPTPA